MTLGECYFTTSALVIDALFFVIFLLASSCFIYSHFTRMRPFSLFCLLLICLHSSLRSIFFIAWVYFNYDDVDCIAPTTSSMIKTDLFMKIVQSLPEGIFLSIVTLNFHCFAQLIFVVRPRTSMIRFFATVQHIINAAVYFWILLFYIKDNSPYQPLIFQTFRWIVIVDTFLITLVYVILSLIVNRYSPNTTHHYITDDVCKVGRETKILFFASILCCLGTSSKVMLLLPYDIEKNSQLLMFLFVISECVPELAILVMQYVILQHIRNCYAIKNDIHISSSFSFLTRNDLLTTISEEPSFYNRVKNSVGSFYGSEYSILSRHSSRANFRPKSPNFEDYQEVQTTKSNLSMETDG